MILPGLTWDYQLAGTIKAGAFLITISLTFLFFSKVAIHLTSRGGDM